MNALAARIVRTGVTALAVVGFAGAAGTAAADGGHGHHRHRGHRGHRGRGHHPVVTDAQRQCMADLGFGPGQPRLDFHDPAVRAQFVAALRSCGILPPAPVEPTTTTTTTTGPVIITSVRAR